MPDPTPPAPPAEAPAPEAPRRAKLAWLQVLYVLFLPVWLGLSVAATMGLANTDSPLSAPAILLVWLYPVAAAAAVGVSHAVFARSPRAAHRWNLLGLPWVVVGAALLVWIFSAELNSAP